MLNQEDSWIDFRYFLEIYCTQGSGKDPGFILNRLLGLIFENSYRSIKHYITLFRKMEVWSLFGE